METLEQLPTPKGGYNKSAEGLFTRTGSDSGTHPLCETLGQALCDGTEK